MGMNISGTKKKQHLFLDIHPTKDHNSGEEGLTWV